MDPRIGILMRAGKEVYYAFVDGYDKPELQGTLEEVERALGIRDPRALPIDAPERAPARTGVAAIRTFIVTVTPKQVVYTGNHVESEHEIEIDARTHAKAISQARQARSSEDGRYGVPAQFRARLKRHEGPQ